MQSKEALKRFKLFAAIFLDGELEGGPLEGLYLGAVVENLIAFLTDIKQQINYGRYNLSVDSIEAMQSHLTQISTIYQFQLSHDSHSSAELIFDTFEKEHHVFFPGGWTAFPLGHAMLYRLFRDNEGNVIFLSFNTGDGSQYHKKIAPNDLSTIAPENYKEKFNPVYAIRFENDKKITQYGGLRAWIKKLVEPVVIPVNDPTYLDNNAQGLYEKIFPASAYLGGEIIDPTPYFSHITSGQRNGTCAQQVTQEMLHSFFAADTDYHRFILDYRLYVLHDVLSTQKIPKDCQKEFQMALANTARMITVGKDLEQPLTLDDKKAYIDQLTAIKYEADAFFDIPFQPKPPEVKEILDTSLHVRPLKWMPGDTSSHDHPVRKKTPGTPILLFDKASSLIDALNCLDAESKKSDKRIFVENVEQLCFTFCDRLQNFKDHPFEQSHTIEDWEKAITLVHKYSIEYFDFYFKNEKKSKKDVGLRNYLFGTNEQKDKDSKKSDLSTKQLFSSPRQQTIALGLMCLMHYAAIMYHARIFEYSKWNEALTEIDYYVAYMPGWLLFQKMSRDFLLSSTDPNISHLFSCLNIYYEAQKNAPIKYRADIGADLLNHYKKIIDAPYFKDEKIALENFFKENIELIRSNIRKFDEQKITKNNIVALYIAMELDNNSDLSNAVKSQNIKISWPLLKALIKTQYHLDLCLYFCTKSLLYTTTASYGDISFYISGKELYDFFRIITCMTGDRDGSDLYKIPKQEKNYSYWSHAMGYGPAALARIAGGKGNQKHITHHVIRPLMDDVYEPHLNSHQIRLLKQCTALDKELRDLRTALPLQGMQIIDYFTRHIDLLENRDYQFYMLFSLFQPRILDLAIEHQADIVVAVQRLCQKGVALGDLAQSAKQLTYRGLFLLKITVWIYGYILSFRTASEALKDTVKKDYEKLEQTLTYWLAHDKRQSMQTELQRLVFYSSMKRYSPSDLSLPEHQADLKRVLYARIYLQQHSKDRIPGTMTQTEDESFEHLFLMLQNIESKAIEETLPLVLEQLLLDQAPFTAYQPEQDEFTDSSYYYLDKNKQFISIDLINGDIGLENQAFVHVPSLITTNHSAYECIIGTDASPLAQKINDQEYQFYWEGEEYYLATQGFFKKINGQWYQYVTDNFLPEYLRSSKNYAWINHLGDHALVMQSCPSGETQLIYHWQNDTLFSHTPKGQVCFKGEARRKILACFASFEDSNQIEIILLDPPEKQQYQFYLPHYQLYGHFDDQAGVTLNYENKTYYLSHHSSPLATGIMIGESKTSKPWECLLLVPIQPFYTQKTISGSRYQLIHDIHRTTMSHKTMDAESYATLQFDDVGKLTTKIPASTEQLYLVYLYCARYQYDKAYALLKKYSFQGTKEELTYLYWLCEKLPAILKHQRDDVTPIVNTPLLTIKLTALALFLHLQKQPEVEEKFAEDLHEFLKKLPDYIIKTYTQYHRLSNNLSDETRIPKHEIEWLADYVWLSAEKTKRIAQKEQLRLQQEIDNSNPKKEADKISLLKKQLKDQIEISLKCLRQQTEGYLAYIYAKRENFFLAEKKIIHFFMPRTTQYGTDFIIPYWSKQQTTYQPLSHDYEVLNKSGTTTLEPGKLYLECEYSNAITYTYLNPITSKEEEETIWSINVGDIVLKKGEPFSSEALNALKEKILDHAAAQGRIPSIVGTLADLQQFTENSLEDGACQSACDLLSLDMKDNVLFANLKHYFRLINDTCAQYDPLREKLKDFCQRTIVASADLNKRLKELSEITERDNRIDRLQISIVLLRALDNPELFRTSYVENFKQYSWNEQNLKKYSIWKIISDENRGFYAKFSDDMLPIPLTRSTTGKKILAIEKNPIQISHKRHKLHEKTQDDQKPLKATDIPPGLLEIAEELQVCSQQLMAKKRKRIEYYQSLSLIEQRAKYNETDLALDEIEAEYRHAITSRIETAIDIKGTQDEVKHTLVRMSEEIVDQYTALKHYATLLPTDLQVLLSLKIKELGAKQLPLSVDALLKHYALGMDESFLNLRQLPTESHPLVRRAVKKLLHDVFLYRQYTRILEALQQLSKPNTIYRQDELRLQLAKLLLELYPLQGNAALELFQYQTQKTVRKDQWVLIESLMQKWDMTTDNRIGQLIMGGGKSKVILPILAFLKADGYHLATIEVSAPLLQTTYQDLRQTAKDVFDQAIELFSFDRNSPADPVSLMSYLAKFKEIIQQKKCVMMAPSSLQSLHLKWRELLYQAQFDPDNSELHESIDLLSQILDLFHTRADAIIDEAHKVLDINIELNYSIGEKTTLDPLFIKTTLDLFDFLEAVNLQVDKENPLAVLNGKPFLDILKNPGILNHPPELITHLMAYYAERYREQRSFLGHPDQAKIQALLNAQWEIFLPLTLKQKLREQYGPSSERDITIAIPYAANNVPTKNLFANFIESLNYTIQMNRLEGIRFDVFKTILQSWKKFDQEYGMCNTDGASEAESRYQTCLNLAGVNQVDLPSHLQAIDVANEEQLRAIYSYFQHNKPFIRYALEEAVLPSIPLYRQKLTSNAIYHANQVKRIQGLTGTPENYPTFDNRITFDMSSSFGTKNYLKTLLKNKKTQLLVQGEENLTELSAIIDMGAHRRGKSNQEVAQEIATQLIGTSIRYVLFFQEDQLCAWKIGGLAQDIVVLPSTDPNKIAQYLQAKPEECFNYYDQSHSTGIDLPQSYTACAAVSVDVTTTLSNFLQAAARMRLLSAGQTIQIFLSPALKTKLGENLTLDSLYECLENTEKNKLENDVFKAGCKKLYNVVQMDLDQRLRKRRVRENIRLFKNFQHLLIDRNSDDIIQLYGKDIKEEEPEVILRQISDAILKEWQIATSSEKINHTLRAQCDAIIQNTLIYCKKTQQTTAELGTEVSIEQQQKVQVELKTEVKTEVVDETLKPNIINTAWAQCCHVKKNGILTGDDNNRSELSVLWRNHPDNVKKYPNIEWSKNLSVSTQFYLTHSRQTSGVLAKDCSLKSMLSTLFWQQNETVHALLICQEEAEVLADRLARGEDFKNRFGSVWLETMNGLTLAGIRPNHIEENLHYTSLKEQIYTLDGEAPLLAAKKDFAWFSAQNLSLLQEQMLQQGKANDSTAFKQLEKRLALKNTQDEPIAIKKMPLSVSDELSAMLAAIGKKQPATPMTSSNEKLGNENISADQKNQHPDDEIPHAPIMPDDLSTIQVALVLPPDEPLEILESIEPIEQGEVPISIIVQTPESYDEGISADQNDQHPDDEIPHVPIIPDDLSTIQVALVLPPDEPLEILESIEPIEQGEVPISIIVQIPESYDEGISADQNDQHPDDEIPHVPIKPDEISLPPIVPEPSIISVNSEKTNKDTNIEHNDTGNRSSFLVRHKIWAGVSAFLMIAAIVTLITLASLPIGGLPIWFGLSVLAVAGITTAAAVFTWSLACLIGNSIFKDGSGEPLLQNDEPRNKEWTTLHGKFSTQPEKYRELYRNPIKNPQPEVDCNAECDLVLMSDLPEDKIPIKGKMYLAKQGNKLEYIVLTPDNKVVTDILDFDVGEILNLATLADLKSDILQETSKRSHTCNAQLILRL